MAGHGRQPGSQARGFLNVVQAGPQASPAGGETARGVTPGTPPFTQQVEPSIVRRDDRVNWDGRRMKGRQGPFTLDRQRYEQVLAFRREVEGEERKRVPASRFKQWHFPHNGEEGEHCGAKIFRAHDNPIGPSHYWAAEVPCRKRECPKCGPDFSGTKCESGCQHNPCKAGAWETRIAGQWENEVKWWMKTDEAHALAVKTDQRRIPIVHVIVSVHPKDWDNLPEEEKTRDEMKAVREASHRYVKAAGIAGAMWVLHGMRVPGKWNDRTCSVAGLHFHYVGVTKHKHGLVDGDYTRRLYKRNRWIVKRIPGWRVSFFATALYQLSHATFPEYSDDADAMGSFYPALAHNSEKGRADGRIGWFLGIGGQAPPVVLEEDVCLVCGHDVPVSMQYEVWKLADAPPPPPFGELDWSVFTDTPPDNRAKASAEHKARTAQRELEAARTACKVCGGETPCYNDHGARP